MINKFKLGAVDWNVIIDSDRLDDLDLMGICEHKKALISVNGNVDSQQMIEQTLYHEVVHCILDSLDETELSGNEEFVQKFALLLYQFEQTKK